MSGLTLPLGQFKGCFWLGPMAYNKRTISSYVVMTKGMCILFLRTEQFIFSSASRLFRNLNYSNFQIHFFMARHYTLPINELFGRFSDCLTEHSLLMWKCENRNTNPFLFSCDFYSSIKSYFISPSISHFLVCSHNYRLLDLLSGKDKVCYPFCSFLFNCCTDESSKLG